MNANDIVNDEMTNKLKDSDLTLEEKLAAIDAAMNDTQVKEDFNRRNGRALDAPVDPSDLTMCDSCQ